VPKTVQGTLDVDGSDRLAQRKHDRQNERLKRIENMLLDVQARLPGLLELVSEARRDLRTLSEIEEV
jgi:hypothetical protein